MPLNDSHPDVRSTRSQAERITRAMLGPKDPVREQGAAARITQRDVLAILGAIAFSAGAAGILRNVDAEQRHGGVLGVRAAHAQVRADIEHARVELARLRVLRERDRPREE